MKFKNIFVIPLLASLLVSCSNTNLKLDKFLTIKDLDSTLTSYSYKALKTEEIKLMMKLNISFLIYCASYGCSSCEKFEPVINELTSQTNLLVYKLDAAKDAEETNYFIEELGDYFCQKDAKGNKYLEYPSVYYVRGENVKLFSQNKISSLDKFSRQLSEYKCSNQIYIANSDVKEMLSKNAKNLPSKEFSLFFFDFKNEQLVNYFNNTYANYLSSIPTTPIILKNCIDYVNSIFVERISINDEGKIGTRNQVLTSDESNVEFVKKILCL